MRAGTLPGVLLGSPAGATRDTKITARDSVLCGGTDSSGGIRGGGETRLHLARQVRHHTHHPLYQHQLESLAVLRYYED